jgi:FkbM family methyltransferase
LTLVSYAQHGEDVRLARIFAGGSGFYVDVGAYDPVSCSITKHFYDRGWRGLNIEASPGAWARISAARPRDVTINVGASDRSGTLTFYEFPVGLAGLCTFSEEAARSHRARGHHYVERPIATKPLAELLAVHAPPVIDFMSVDVEGYERQALAGADLARYRPRVLIVEATEPASSTPTHSTWEPLVLQAGYQFVVFDGLNRFYVRNEDAELGPALALPPNPLDDYVPYVYQSEIDRLREQVQEFEQGETGLVRVARSVQRLVRQAREAARRRSAGQRR